MENHTAGRSARQSDNRVPMVCFPLASVRDYLGGMETLVREARRSQDPRVILAALAILRRQARTIDSLLVEVA